MNLKTVKQQRKINETKSCFFEKANKINNHLANLTKKKGEKTQITNNRNERGVITTNSMGIKRLIKEYYEQLCQQIQ